MIRAEPIGLLNTGLPVVVLLAVAIGLPLLLVRTNTRRHEQVWSAIAMTALVLLMLGTNLFGITYALRGHSVGAALVADPGAVAWYFLRLAGMAAIIWVPVLALVWFSLAQRVERNKGAALVTKGRGDEDVMRNGTQGTLK